MNSGGRVNAANERMERMSGNTQPKDFNEAMNLVWLEKCTGQTLEQLTEKMLTELKRDYPDVILKPCVCGAFPTINQNRHHWEIACPKCCVICVECESSKGVPDVIACWNQAVEQNSSKK